MCIWTLQFQFCTLSEVRGSSDPTSNMIWPFALWLNSNKVHLSAPLVTKKQAVDCSNSQVVWSTQAHQYAAWVIVHFVRQVFPLDHGSGQLRRGVSWGFVAAQSGARASWCAAGHNGKSWSQPGSMQPLPNRLLPVPPAAGILQHSLPAPAVHDG